MRRERTGERGFSAQRRVIRPELLDEQAPEAAAASLRDLVQINRLLGGHAVLLRTLRSIYRPESPFSFLDVGAASGDMGRVVLREFPMARLTCLDYRSHHLAAAAKPAVVADAFRMPFQPKSFDVVHCSLFLHHFVDEEVVDLLRGFGEISRRHVIVTDLERHRWAYMFLPATRWIFRWDPITLHDGPISVAAAFTKNELHSRASAAGLQQVKVKAHRPAFRLSLVASKSG